MKKGLIIIGYPGIGKSTRAGEDNCIDLEINIFGSPDDRNYYSYCATAFSLASQGYTVFVSSHPAVRWAIHLLILSGYKSIPVVLICPPTYFKGEWVDKLKKRYERDGLEIHRRAYEHVRDNYISDIVAMLSEKYFPVYQFNSMDYDLGDYISKARKEFCKG